MKPVHWILALSIDQSQATEFNELMQRLVRETDREKGTMACELNFNEDGTICYIYERFTDADAAMIHLGMIVEQFEDRLLSTCTVTEMTVLGYASDEIKEALKEFNPTVLQQRTGFARFIA